MELSSQQLALQEKAAALSNGMIRTRAADIDQSREYPWDVVEALKAERFMGMTIPPEYGGEGRSFLDTVLVIGTPGPVMPVWGPSGQVMPEAVACSRVLWST